MIKKVLIIGIIGMTLIGGLAIKDIETSNSGMMITFRDNTGYYLGK